MPCPNLLSGKPFATIPLLAAVLLGISACGGAEPENPRGHHRAGATEIVLLGATHLADEKGILSKKRQQELSVVAERLAGWEPDQLFVECSPDEQAALDSVYRAYRRGAYDLSNPPGRVGRGEIYQIGFRAAKAAGIGGVVCTDAEVVVPESQARTVAKKHNPALFKSYRRYAEKGIYPDSLLADNTIREALLTINRDSILWKNHKYYIYYYARMGTFEESGAKVRRESKLAGKTFAAPFEIPERHMNELREVIESVGGHFVGKVGPKTDYVVLMDRKAAQAESRPAAGADTISVAEFSDLIEQTSTTWVGFPDHHIGADMVAQRYKRNLRIYANITHKVKESDDRVLLMIGQAHIWTLRQFFRDNPDFKVVPVEEIL